MHCACTIARRGAISTSIAVWMLALVLAGGGCAPPAPSQSSILDLAPDGDGATGGDYPAAGDADNDTTVTDADSTVDPDGSEPPSATALLGVDVTRLDFGAALSEDQFRVTNTGAAALEYSASVSELWLVLELAGGANPDQATELLPRTTHVITARVDRAGLPPGTHQAEIQLLTSGGERRSFR